MAINSELETIASAAWEIEQIIIVSLVGLLVLFIIGVFVWDKLQRKHSVLRNYPVIGHFRYFFESLGKYFRQYFFAMDREELPFNREQRSWVFRAAKNITNVVGFGSTRNLRPTGTILFVNSPFPVLNKDSVAAHPVTIGPDCEHPYTTASLFNISGMSYGALSKVAVQALSHGAKKAGCWLNTGEGGISPYHLEGGCDLVAQIGTAKYGYRDKDGNLSKKKLQEAAALPQVKMFEIKLSQGAKPGKGGLLPAAKVDEEIATIRGIPTHEDSVSPNRFPEIDSINDLLDFIDTVRSATKKPVGCKFVLGDPAWLDELFKGIKKRGLKSAPDFITLDSATGGSGAAPMSLVDYVGLPIEESLPVLIDKLVEYKMRDRIKVIASGKLILPGDVAWALCVGADFINCGRGFMFSLGCIQAMRCHLNTCPTGVTTHDKNRQHALVPEVKADRVANYARNLCYEVGVISHSCGVQEPRELTREHARMVRENGQSVSLAELYQNR